MSPYFWKSIPLDLKSRVSSFVTGSKNVMQVTLQFVIYQTRTPLRQKGEVLMIILVKGSGWVFPRHLGGLATPKMPRTRRRRRPVLKTEQQAEKGAGVVAVFMSSLDLLL